MDSIENLERELRQEGTFSEKDIVQILSFVFTLHELLPASCKEVRNYFVKFISFKAENYLRRLSEEKVEFTGTFTKMVEDISLILLQKFSKNEIDKAQFLQQAKEQMIRELGGIKQKIIEVATTSLTKALEKLPLDANTAKNLMGLFIQEVKIQSA